MLGGKSLVPLDVGMRTKGKMAQGDLFGAEGYCLLVEVGGHRNWVHAKGEAGGKMKLGDVRCKWNSREGRRGFFLFVHAMEKGADLLLCSWIGIETCKIICI